MARASVAAVGDGSSTATSISSVPTSAVPWCVDADAAITTSAVPAAVPSVPAITASPAPPPLQAAVGVVG